MAAATQYSGVLTDEQGRKYVQYGGQKVYLSPVAFGGAAPAGGGVFHTAPEFNTGTGGFSNGLDWGNILSLVVAGVLSAGVADAMMGVPAGTAAAAVSEGGGSAGAGVATGATSATGGASAASTASAGAGVEAASAATGGHVPGAFLGLSESEWAKILAMAGTSGLSAALAPSTFQPRQTFRGTSADPVASLTSVQDVLRSVLGGAIDKAGAPVSLPDAHVGSLPSFAGGGLPMPIGVTSAADSGHADLLRPFSLPGINMGTGGASVGGARYAPPGSFTPTDTSNPIGDSPLSNRTPSAPGSQPSLPGQSGSGARQAIVNPGAVPRIEPSALAAPTAPGLPSLDPRTSGALKLLLHAAGYPEAA